MGECAKADCGSAFTSLRVAPWAALGGMLLPIRLNPVSVVDSLLQP